jgi:hypothetical protein
MILRPTMAHPPSSSIPVSHQKSRAVSSHSNPLKVHNKKHQQVIDDEDPGVDSPTYDGDVESYTTTGPHTSSEGISNLSSRCAFVLGKHGFYHDLTIFATDRLGSRFFPSTTHFIPADQGRDDTSTTKTLFGGEFRLGESHAGRNSEVGEGRHRRSFRRRTGFQELHDQSTSHG